ncbi:hypothetical protein [Hydrogenophaga sp. PAMC20947]|uniref:hypothetical protein n=1 Tax=Hydrogenophaga sp. PAMC20947 TaxID=2565558 RepID=UPI00109D96BA|nr:hypothetical protein [Hydrogenophaga sp. PAMC20947]QCB46043.1 hypothetical protein E5678_08445 [Hydrogenophaga sp. PAMC20947]
MTITTFGFDAVQDRIWMRVHEQERTVWFTRRLLGQFLGPVIGAFEQATPGAQGGAPPERRAAIEHDLSLHETLPGQSAPQIRAGRVLPSPGADPQQGLCSRVATRTNQQTVSMTFDTPGGSMVLPLTRKGMHLWLRGLSMVLKQAHWGLPLPLPAWLEAGVMPPALQGLIDRPLPKGSEGD